MGKNSFSLFESLLCLFILSVILVSVSSESFYDNFDDEYILLNNLDNRFNIDSFNNNFKITLENLNIIVNKTEVKTIKVKKIQFNNGKIGLFKYEME